jgi:DUF4097 and DUF4098 domain-containing protein YvlB
MRTLSIIIAVLNLTICYNGISQDKPEEIKIPFTKPGEPGYLDIENFGGNIVVTGHKDKEVVLSSSDKHPAIHHDRTTGSNIPHPYPTLPETSSNDDEISKEGLKKIKSGTYDIKITEESNKIMIKSGSPMKSQNFNIKVPYDCSLKISTVNGNISVNKVNGEIEINTINGRVGLDKISGSVVASSINGLIKVKFVEVAPDVPMAFSTINNHIDVTLPKNIKATLKMKTDRGDIYSNFDFDVKSVGEYKPYTTQSWAQWTKGDINGGGAEFVFKSLHGDIHIRKGE